MAKLAVPVLGLAVGLNCGKQRAPASVENMQKSVLKRYRRPGNVIPPRARFPQLDAAAKIRMPACFVASMACLTARYSDSKPDGMTMISTFQTSLA